MYEEEQEKEKAREKYCSFWGQTFYRHYDQQIDYTLLLLEINYTSKQHRMYDTWYVRILNLILTELEEFKERVCPVLTTSK